jgi:hypothetical protein
MSDNRQLGDFNRPVEKIKQYPDLRLNFTTLGIGRSGGRYGKTDLEYEIGGFLAGWWEFRRPAGTPTAVNIYNGDNNGTLTGISDINLTSDNPFMDVYDGPDRKRPLTATFNDSSTVYLVDNGSGVGDIEYTPSASTTLGFCIQAWVKRTSGSSNDDTIISLGRTNSGGAANTKNIYRLYFDDGSDKLTFRLYEGSEAQTADFIEEKMDSAWAYDGNWAHILLYVDQTKASSDPGIAFFVNGVRQSSTTTKNSWGGLTLPSPLPPLTIGAQRFVNGSGVFQENSAYFKGELAEIAVWKDIPKGSRLVNENTAAVLYAARKGFYSNKSGILSEPYRLELRKRDSATGSYPTINRTGDRTRMGKYNVLFDDRKTVIFSTAPAAYPQVLNSDSPNFIYPTSSIGTVTRSLRKGVSDSRVEFTPGESLGPYDDSLLEFQETDFYMTGTKREAMDGFTSPLKSKTAIFFDISPSGDESAPLTLTRANRHRNVLLEPNLSATKPSKTGFAYWNNVLRKWDQIGLTDPLTGNPIRYDYAIKGATTAINSCTSGTNMYPQQFVPCNHQLIGDTMLDATSSHDEGLGGILRSSMYHLIGSPTITSFAPFKTIYHATSSNTIRMSDYISHPFLLEKVVVKMEGRAQRVHSRPREGSANRHQDDYVFFIYRQERANISGSFRGGSPDTPTPSKSFRVDSAADFSGSQRFLICSGVMSFYNSHCYTMAGAAQDRSTDGHYIYKPINSPAFSHDFAIEQGPTGSQLVLQYTGSLNLEIQPAVAGRGFKGRSVLASATVQADRTTTPPKAVYHYWPGGTSIKPFMHGGARTGMLGSDYDSVYPSEYTGKVGIDASYGGNDGFTFKQYYEEHVAAGSATGFPDETFAGRNLPIQNIDPRTLKPLGPLQSSRTTFGSNSAAEDGLSSTPNQNQSAISPYLLFPEDEIVFGLEAAIAPGNVSELTGSGNSGGGFGGQNSLTGSYLELFQSQERQTVVFYGSLVKDGVENHHSLNQPLSSDAIHEAIFEPIVDQWDISSEAANAGTYVDNYVTGAMISEPYPHNDAADNDGKYAPLSEMRGVAGSFVRGTAPNRAGSFQRSVTSIDHSQRFYDTIMPDIQEYAKRAGATMLTTGSAVPAIVFDPPEFYIESHPDGESTRSTMPFPYEGNPERRVDDTTNMQIVGRGDGFSGMGFLFGNSSQLQIKQLLFQVGFKGGEITTYYTPWHGAETFTFTVNSYDHAHPQATGSTGFRYGIQNIVPEYPTAVFRRDRYGQFRDMLEQRLDGRFYEPRLDDSEIVKLATKTSTTTTTTLAEPVVMCKFTLSSSNEEVSPYLTTCSNMSMAATSSIPYVDGEITNVTNPTTLKTVALVRGSDLATSVRTSIQTPTISLGKS